MVLKRSVAGKCLACWLGCLLVLLILAGCGTKEEDTTGHRPSSGPQPQSNQGQNTSRKLNVD